MFIKPVVLFMFYNNIKFALKDQCILVLNFSITIFHIGYPVQTPWFVGRRDRMVDLQLPMQSVPITTNILSSNPAQAIYTQYTIM